MSTVRKIQAVATERPDSEAPAHPAPRDPSREGGLRELLRVTPVPSAIEAPRLNLIVPTLRPEATYGGIQTAIEFFHAVARDAERLRLISVEPLAEATAAAFPRYTVVPHDEDSDEALQIVSTAPNGPLGASLRVGRRDVFIATFWPTAAFVLDVLDWQARTFGEPPGRFVYLIQDYEPGFYPRSPQSVLAAATYDRPEATIAVFNTELLREAFHRQDVHFDHEFAFAPRIAPGLRENLDRPPVRRSRQIVVYGRPSKPRNGFPLVVDGLRAWRRANPESDWSVVSIGEHHVDIDLGFGLTMRSLGKLDLRSYGDVMRRSAIGIALMFSPHPSYPPLEMAVHGLRVLTNRYGNKDLSTWHDNIHSIGTLTPEGLAHDLEDLCERFAAQPTAGDAGVLHETSYLAEGDQFPFADEVGELLQL